MPIDDTDLFRTQLRALLRASAYGKLRIMFPMIATLNEFRSAKALLLEEKAKLVAEGVTVSEQIEVGMMVEIPSAAVLADQFAKEVDFFSIGTNDLIQYTMAADRMNEKVSYLYQPYNPSILRLVKMVIDAAHKEGKWTGMCGEMAGDQTMNEKVSYLYQPYNPSILRLVKMVIDAAHKEGKWTGMCGEMAGDQTAIPLLLGLGLDEFSMSATSILPARSLISKLSKAEMADLAAEALNKSTVEEVIELVESIQK